MTVRPARKANRDYSPLCRGRLRQWSRRSQDSLALAAANARASLLLRRAAVLGWSTRREPALSILATAARKSASAFSRLCSLTDWRVFFMEVLMTFLVMRLCFRRLMLWRSRLPADGEFGMALSDPAMRVGGAPSGRLGLSTNRPSGLRPSSIES